MPNGNGANLRVKLKYNERGGITVSDWRMNEWYLSSK